MSRKPKTSPTGRLSAYGPEIQPMPSTTKAVRTRENLAALANADFSELERRAITTCLQKQPLKSVKRTPLT